MLFNFSTPVLIRHLWQPKTVVFLHWCLICAVLLQFTIVNRDVWIVVELKFKSNFVMEIAN